jgi:KipI family sensor histidine kinase inhibitor
MQIRNFSERVVELRDPEKTRIDFWVQVRNHLEKHLREAEEVINTEDSVVIIFNSSRFVDHKVIGMLLEQFSDIDQGYEQTSNTFIIEVNYSIVDTDLASVSQQLNISVEECINLHSGGKYQIAMYGFIPGFVYLTGLPQELQLPRKEKPSLYVPSGSVAIAESYTGVYPSDTQGGWHTIGFTEYSFLEGLTQGEVQPGDHIKFRPV